MGNRRLFAVESALQVFPRASVVSTLMRARRHGLLYFEGEIISVEIVQKILKKNIRRLLICNYLWVFFRMRKLTTT